MNDPRITAYALGELTGRDREEFERDLAGSEPLQRELAETISLSDAIGNLPAAADTLTDESRQTLRRACAENLSAARRKARMMKFVRNTTALAASVALIFGIAALVLSNAAYLQKKPAPLAAAAGESGSAVTVPSPAVSAPAAPVQVASVDLTPATTLPQTATLQAPPPTFAAPTSEVIATTQAVAELNSRINTGADKLAVSGQPGSYPAPMVAAVSAPATAPETLSSGNGQIAAWRRDPTAGQGSRSSHLAGGVPEAKKKEASEEGRLVFRAAVDSDAEFVTESYDSIDENVFKTARENPLSTFSIDVDTASYANVRRFLQNDQLPPSGAIRTEELINYFSYGYPQPASGSPFSVNLEVSHAPWDAKRELVRIGLKGREIPADERGPANLVFLLDVSGSMDQPAKLPLLRRSLAALVENLSPKDRVAIVVYAGSSGLALPSTLGTDKPRILDALGNLKAGGSTNGGEGIRLAYNTAREHFLKEGNNRVILCTDGDFNVGTTSQSELVKLIEKERASGVFLSVLGFGTGNLKDSTMEKLADKGNGNYAYIDSITEGRKVLVEQMGATLFTIAKDVKIQVEFNPARVAGYRLIGYENRLLAKEDFNDDKKDAGEIGAGHTVTALYEVIPAGQPLPDQPSVDPLKYQPVPPASAEVPSSLKASPELLTLKLRYKAPDGEKSTLLELPLTVSEIPAFEKASSDFQFAAAVAAFSMKLRGSPTAGDLGWDAIQKIVRRTLGEDPGSYRAEFLTLIEKASRLASPAPRAD